MIIKRAKYIITHLIKQYIFLKYVSLNIKLINELIDYKKHRIRVIK
jgi:hypothetical protein